jgi:hypothetical protein
MSDGIRNIVIRFDREGKRIIDENKLRIEVLSDRYFVKNRNLEKY